MELYNTEKENHVKRQFRLMQDAPQLKKGAIVEEVTDSNTTDFVYKTKKEFAPHWPEDTCFTFKRNEVLDQPEWFEEVKPLWVRISDLSIFEDMLKTYKNNRN